MSPSLAYNFDDCFRSFDPYRITKVAYENVGNNVFKCSYNERGKEIHREQIFFESEGLVSLEPGGLMACIDPYEKRKDKKNKILLLCR